MSLIEDFYNNYNEKYFSMALIYFRLLTDEKATDLKSTSDASDNFKDNPIATEWPSGQLKYLSKYSALVSDEEINFNNPNKIYCLACIPIQHTVTRRTWKEANECSFTLAQEDFPFDPSKIQVANVYMFQGITVNDNFINEIKLRSEGIKDFSESLIDPVDGKYPIDIIFNNLKNINFGSEITLRDYSIKFAGFVDNISANITSEGRTVDFACRDIVGMMLDQKIAQEDFKKIAEAMVEGFLEDVIRQVLSLSSAGKGLIIHGIGFPSKNISFPKNETIELSNKNSKSRINKDMSYWDLVVDLCQLCGLTCQIEYLQYQKNLISDVDKPFIAVPSLAIYTADIAYGQVDKNNMKGRLSENEFYNINGVSKNVESDGYYYWFLNRPKIEIDANGSEATITKDIGAGLIPSVKVIAFNDKSIDEPFVEGWFPGKMFNKTPGDLTIKEYNKRLKQLQVQGIKYFDPKAYTEITVPGQHDAAQCEKFAKSFYNQMVRGKNKLTIKSGRYYFTNEDNSKIIGIGNLRCGHAVSILWPDLNNQNNFEFAEDSDFINLNKISDEETKYFLTANNDKKLVTIWYVTSVEYSLTPDGFSVNIELIRSLEA
jgi:hypothetical protein